MFKFIKNRKLLNTVAALICSVLVAFVGAFASIKSAEMERIFNMYNPKEAEGSFLTEDEEELIYRLPNHVGKDDVVAVNFWEGGGFIYALVDRKPTQVYSTNVSNPADKKRAEDVAIVHDKLSKATSDPEVCPAIRDLNVKYALELEPGVHYPGTEEEIAGVNNLDSAPGFELVDSDDAALYKITACG